MTAMPESLAFAAARVAEQAAIAAADWIGRGDNVAADQAAVDAMRTALNDMAISGRVVIGEGERDEAPMLYIGEEVGAGGPEIDIALDPLEGTTLTAKAMANALAVIAFAPRGHFLHAPDTYMDKIAIGPGFAPGTVDLARSPSDNVRALAGAKGVDPQDICVCVLDRERHQAIIDDLRSVGARVKLITDGDVAGVMHTTDPSSDVDMYLGQGGAPEGVLAAAALRCVGGFMQGRLIFRKDIERERAARTGITDFDKVYSLEEMASGDAIFCATGVTDGAMLGGVKAEGDSVMTETLVLHAASGTRRTIFTERMLG